MNKNKIALLRGINVGGKRKILMADLRALLGELDFANVRTYIQSGNVFFQTKSKKNNLSLADDISKAIMKQYGFEVPVMVLSVEEIQMAIESNPFYTDDADIKFLHLTFLSEIPDEELLEQLKGVDYSPDAFEVIGKNVFLKIADKYHKSKLSNNLFEKKLKVSATTRNWKTVLKLLELSE